MSDTALKWQVETNWAEPQMKANLYVDVLELRNVKRHSKSGLFFLGQLIKSVRVRVRVIEHASGQIS